MSRLSEKSEPKREILRSLGAEKSAFVQRLHTILSHWPSADRLARAMGVSPSAFRKWLKGEAEPSRERLVALARAAGVGVAWLAEGDGPAPTFDGMANLRRRGRSGESGNDMDWSQFVALPDQAAPVAPGAPSLRRYLLLRNDWIRAVCGVEPDHVQVELAEDESMAPTIKPRDVVLIDTSESAVVRSGIYVVESAGQRLIRRAQPRHDGSMVLLTDNSAYQPDVVSKEAAGSIKVVGRVVWVGGAV